MKEEEEDIKEDKKTLKNEKKEKKQREEELKVKRAKENFEMEFEELIDAEQVLFKRVAVDVAEKTLGYILQKRNAFRRNPYKFVEKLMKRNDLKETDLHPIRIVRYLQEIYTGEKVNEHLAELIGNKVSKVLEKEADDLVKFIFKANSFYLLEEHPYKFAKNFAKKFNLNKNEKRHITKEFLDELEDRTNLETNNTYEIYKNHCLKSKLLEEKMGKIIYEILTDDNFLLKEKKVIEYNIESLVKEIKYDIKTSIKSLNLKKSKSKDFYKNKSKKYFLNIVIKNMKQKKLLDKLYNKNEILYEVSNKVIKIFKSIYRGKSLSLLKEIF